MQIFKASSVAWIATLAIALSWVASVPVSAARPNGSEVVVFDARHVERIVPGSTAREEIRAWFGEPETIVELEDGTAYWVYMKTRTVEGDIGRARQHAYEKKKNRSANARRFAENTTAIAKAGRGQINNLFDWIDRTFRYPPRAIRRTQEDPGAEQPSVSSAPVHDEFDAEVEASEFAEIDSDPVEETKVSTVAQMELSIAFARDGVVDKFEYQRTTVR